MKISPEEISSIIREQIANFDTEVEVKEVGTVLSVGFSTCSNFPKAQKVWC